MLIEPNSKHHVRLWMLARWIVETLEDVSIPVSDQTVRCGAELLQSIAHDLTDLGPPTLTAKVEHYSDELMCRVLLGGLTPDILDTVAREEVTREG